VLGDDVAAAAAKCHDWDWGVVDGYVGFESDSVGGGKTLKGSGFDEVP